MAKNRVVIELSPTRLEVALIRGESIAASKSQRLNIPNYAEAWPGALDAIQPQLAAMVKELGAQGAQATILYSSPTAATGVFSCAEGAGAVGVGRAAQLALAEAAGFALDSNPHDLERLTTDKPGDASIAAQVHTLGIADTEPTAQALAEWLARSGLEPLALVPIDVPGTVAAVETALRLATGASVALVLFAGEHGSALAAASAGRLRFIRQIGIGTESLVAVLAREIRAGAEGRTVTLNHDSAAKLVLASGIPERNQILDAERGITGDAILPLVQPILQRCVVDIKQSMRFGLEEKEREGATLHGIGPGARVPRLLKLISDQTGLVSGPADQNPASNPTGNLAAWVGGRAMRVNLLPRGLRAQKTSRRVRRALWVGVGVALALVGADTVMTRIDLARETDAAAKLKQRLEVAKSATAIQDKLTGIQGGLAVAKQRLGAKLDAIGDWDAVMAMVARQTPAAIRLTQMQFTYDSGKPACHLVGHAPLSGQTDSNAALKAYMDALTATPIVRTCRLGATQRGEGDNGPVQNFEMTLLLVELPAQPHSPDPSISEVPSGTEDNQ